MGPQGREFDGADSSYSGCLFSLISSMYVKGLGLTCFELSEEMKQQLRPDPIVLETARRGTENAAGHKIEVPNELLLFLALGGHFSDSCGNAPLESRNKSRSSCGCAPPAPRCRAVGDLECVFGFIKVETTALCVLGSEPQSVGALLRPASRSRFGVCGGRVVAVRA